MPSAAGTERTTTTVLKREHPTRGGRGGGEGVQTRSSRSAVSNLDRARIWQSAFVSSFLPDLERHTMLRMASLYALTGHARHA